MANHTDATTAQYIEKVRAIPLLSQEEEQKLARRALRGDRAAADKLVSANLRYVVSVALKYRRYGIPVSELISEGSIGLMTAVRKFEPARGHRFVTYAGYWIRAYVLDYVVRSSSMVGGGSGPFRSKVFFRLRRERAKLTQLNLGPSEIVEILAKQFSVTETRMVELLTRLDGKDISLSQPAFADAQVSLQDTLTSPEPTAEDHYLAAERAHQLEAQARTALQSLDKRERLIIEKRVLSDADASLAALGRKLGVSRERARQLEVRAKDKLRREFRTLGVEPQAA